MQVEDEVADAVVDGGAFVVLDGLQRVGVVADERVGSCIDEPVGVADLVGRGAQNVLLPPMQTHDDARLRVGVAQKADAADERIEGFLADARLFGQVGEVLERQSLRDHQPDVAGRGGEQDRLRGLLHVLSGSDGGHSSAQHLVFRIDEGFAPLVDGVVVGEVEVGEPITLERVEPLGFGSEDEPLEHGRLDFCGGTFEISYDEIGVF